MADHIGQFPQDNRIRRNFLITLKEIFDRKVNGVWQMNQTRTISFTSMSYIQPGENQYLFTIQANANAAQAVIWMNRNIKTEVVNAYGINGEGFYSIGNEHNPTINPNFTRRLAGIISVVQTNLR